MRANWLAVGFVVVAACCALSEGGPAAEPLKATIDYLIGCVEQSDATFVRNGNSHKPAEAAAHIRAKYDHFKREIKTPEDFIRLCASKSLLTGKPYMVRRSDGSETPLDGWLLSALERRRKASPAS